MRWSISGFSDKAALWMKGIARLLAIAVSIPVEEPEGDRLLREIDDCDAVLPHTLWLPGHRTGKQLCSVAKVLRDRVL